MSNSSQWWADGVPSTAVAVEVFDPDAKPAPKAKPVGSAQWWDDGEPSPEGAQKPVVESFPPSSAPAQQAVTHHIKETIEPAPRPLRISGRFQEVIAD